MVATRERLQRHLSDDSMLGQELRNWEGGPSVGLKLVFEGFEFHELASREHFALFVFSHEWIKLKLLVMVLLSVAFWARELKVEPAFMVFHEFFSLCMNLAYLEAS